MRRIISILSFLICLLFVSTRMFAAQYAGKITVEVGKTVEVSLPGNNGTYMEKYHSGTPSWNRTGQKFIITDKGYSWCEIKGSSVGTGTLSFVGGYIVGWMPEDLSFYWDVEVVEAKPVLVKSISLNKYSQDIKPGESFQLTATVSPTDASNKSVKWESSDTTVAKVSSTGLVKGISSGKATIFCEAADGSGVKQWCQIRVTLGIFSLKTTEGATIEYEITDVNAKTCKVYSTTNTSDLTKITIPSSAYGYSVTCIRSNAFLMKKMESITIPNTVTTIEEHAFLYCSLNAVNITDLSAWCKIKFGGISANPLGNAHNLYLNGKLVQDLIIPDEIISIGEHTFEGCSCSSVTIPKSVTSIGESAFKGCENLNAVNITDLSAWCKVQFDDQWSNPLDYAHNLYLNGKLVQDLVIPEEITSIGKFAFIRCSCSSVAIHNGVKSIGNCAFADCTGLTSISIPRSVTEIGTEAFFYNENLKEIRVDSNNPVYDSREGCNAIIETATDKIVCGCKNTKIPKSVKIIGKFACYYPRNYNIVIPCNVEELEYGSIYSLYGNVTIGKGVKKMDQPLYATKVIRSLIEYPNNDPVSFVLYSNNEVVYVPKGTKSRYLASTSWSQFQNIVEANFVTDVSFENSSVEIIEGQKMQLTANITPADADNQELEWESSDEDVVIVKPTGEIIAMGTGTAYVYATAMDCGSTYGTCKVTVTDGSLITDIELDTTADTLSIGESLKLTPTIYPLSAKNQKLEWKSSNEDVAIVISNGEVVAMGTGTAVITATATDGTGVSASCTITVVQRVKSIELNHTSYTLDIGESVTLAATVKPENAENKNVKWSSSDDNIIVVNQKGKVMCLGYGEATITATAQDGSNVSASCVINCINAIEDVNADSTKDVIISTTGVRLSAPRKGINIINGKKVFVK